VTPLGHSAKDSWDALLEGKSGAGPLTLFDATQFSVRIACEVKSWEPGRYLPAKRLKELDRFSEFAVVAAQRAVADAELGLAESEQTRAGCIIGVSLGGLNEIEDATRTLRERGPSKVSPYMIPAVCGNLAAGQVSIEHHLKGPSFCAASACATGAHSIGEAAEWIRRGRADVMIAGGTEATVTPVAMGGFQAMRALSKRNDDPTGASRPFDRNRDGFVCGEGAGVIVLESEERARRRGARIYAELTGYGASSDAFHICLPTRDGEGCARSMRMALEDAELEPEQIDYINAHATSTPAGDVAEIQGICAVFGERAARGGLPVSSTKSMTGHMLGAAGAVELIFSLLAIRDQVAPPTINVDSLDVGPPIDVVPNVKRELAIKHVLSNSFGFGGTNATLIASAFST
jgi:3-oxoacyl-[acyl-carrier-protein] synthase II